MGHKPASERVCIRISRLQVATCESVHALARGEALGADQTPAERDVKQARCRCSGLPAQ